MNLTSRARFAASRAAAALVLFAGRPAAIGAALTWRRFSVTSFRMVDDLRRQGVLPTCVIDIGANVGQFAYAALRLFRPRQLHVFEPLRQATAVLQRDLGSELGVVIHPVALGAVSSEQPLHVNAHPHSSSLLPLGNAHRVAFPEAKTVTDVTVPVRTLDDELRGTELSRPVLLKLDVQGYERWVLDGAPATLAGTEWVVLEASFRPMYDGEPVFLDVVAYLGARGFQFLRPVGWLVAPGTGEVLQCDALFRRVV